MIRMLERERERELEPEEEVLVLLPTSSNKLLAQWQGPYCVVGAVNYEAYMLDKRKRRAVYHINMLKKWYPPETTQKKFIIQMDH